MAHISNYLPKGVRPQSKDRELTDKQQKFLDNLIETGGDPKKAAEYDMKEILSRIVDDSCFSEYKSEYGQTILCGHASIGGYSVGIIANQRKHIKTENSGIQLGGVIYSDSADKTARFVMNCNQDNIPIIFFHDVNGFMVGKTAEWGGIA